MNQLRTLERPEHPTKILCLGGGDGWHSRQLSCAAIDRGYVYIKFTGTNGGTELGVRLDTQASDWSQADFSKATGAVHLEGTLTLNYVKVRVVVDFQLDTLTGNGHLVIQD